MFTETGAFMLLTLLISAVTLLISVIINHLAPIGIVLIPIALCSCIIVYVIYDLICNL